MTTTIKPVTAEELLSMPNSKWLELYDGELKTVSPANMRHGNMAVRIAFLLESHVRPRKLGRVFVEGGYVLKRNPDTVLGPDVSFVRESRIPKGKLPEKFIEGCPDLAVEIISPTNPRREIEDKMARYMKSGTPLGWLVDPGRETVDVYRANQAPQSLGKGESISGEDVIVDFSCEVAEFFA
jgi:Uma2 family endonuclease